MRPGDGAAARLAWITRFVLATGLGAVLGLVGPFGSFFNGPAWQRMAYWIALAWLTAALLGLWSRPLRRLSDGGIRPWAGLAASAVGVSIPLAVGSWFLARAIWPALRGLPGLTPAAWYLQSLTIALPAAALFGLVQRRETPAKPGALPPPSRGILGAAEGQVLCLKMEDHYVRVHTPAGSHLVSATLTQALAVLDQTRGLQVHRSWWVAAGAVRGSIADGRNLRLVLANGLEVPVARSAVGAVRAAGWLDAPNTAD